MNQHTKCECHSCTQARLHPMEREMLKREARAVSPELDAAIEGLVDALKYYAATYPEWNAAVYTERAKKALAAYHAATRGET